MENVTSHWYIPQITANVLGLAMTTVQKVLPVVPRMFLHKNDA